MPEVIIAGCGPGAIKLIAPAVWETAENCDVLIGPERLLEYFKDTGADIKLLKGNYKETLDWIAEVVKSQLPTCKDSRWLAHGFRGDPKNYVTCLHNLENRDDELRWWVMQQLTEDGWEPFQAIPETEASREEYPIRYLLFRKETETGG